MLELTVPNNKPDNLKQLATCRLYTKKTKQIGVPACLSLFGRYTDNSGWSVTYDTIEIGSLCHFEQELNNDSKVKEILLDSSCR